MQKELKKIFKGIHFNEVENCVNVFRVVGKDIIYILMKKSDLEYKSEVLRKEQLKRIVKSIQKRLYNSV